MEKKAFEGVWSSGELCSRKLLLQSLVSSRRNAAQACQPAGTTPYALEMQELLDWWAQDRNFIVGLLFSLFKDQSIEEVAVVVGRHLQLLKKPTVTVPQLLLILILVQSAFHIYYILQLFCLFILIMFESLKLKFQLKIKRIYLENNHNIQ